MYLKDEFFQKEAKDYDFLKAPNQLNILYEDEKSSSAGQKAGSFGPPR